MRRARVNDHWKRVYRRNYRNDIKQLNFRNVMGLGDGTVSFYGGITAICGENGVGKSTLLNALRVLFNPNDSIEIPIILSKYQSSHFNSSLIINGAEVTRELSLREEFNAEDIEAIFVETSSFVVDAIRTFSEMTNKDSILAQYQPNTADAEYLQLLSYIIGKRYESSLAYEVEVDTDIFEPYFQVSISGQTYGTEFMGLGEIAVHYILWNLHTAPRDSVILIEEPETYISSKAQTALLNVLAKYSDQKGLRIILTTHSQPILKRIPIESVILMGRLENEVTIRRPTTSQEYLNALGITVTKDCLIFVEDKVAKVLAECWIGKFAPLLNQHIEVISLESESKIISMLKSFPRVSTGLNIIGLFDADKKGQISESYNWGYSFLPGDSAPENDFIKQVTKFPLDFAKIIGKNEDIVIITLSAIQGMDHHDWLEELSERLGVSLGTIVHAIFELSIQDTNYYDQALEDFNKFFEVLISNQKSSLYQNIN
jgi:predicted ATPase